MNSVRQVSMVLRAVALICRVTLRPKKLKPLWWRLVIWYGMGGDDGTYPMDTMISSDVTAIARLVKI